MESGLEAAAGIREGDLLAGKYRVDRLLGFGAMGVVVAAHHVHLDTRVAIKLILPAMLSNPEVVRRFAREAKAAAKITGEHVARVLDVGALETGAPYMVMELLDGLDLAQWLESHGPLPIDQAVDFILQATIAVAEAHGVGIVHLDLKPSNLFCVRRPDGRPSIKVLDFGISKVASGRGPSAAVSKSTSIAGTPLYMAPEQMVPSKKVDLRADIWTLGLILFELLTGQSPFQATTLPRVCSRIATGTPDPIRAFRPGVPAALEAVIFKCLEKSPGERYQNVGELAAALLPFGSKRASVLVEQTLGIIKSAGLSAGARAESAPSTSAPRDPAALESVPPLSRSAPPLGAPWVRWAAIAVSVLVLLLAATIGAFRRSDVHPQASAREPTSTVLAPLPLPMPPAASLSPLPVSPLLVPTASLPAALAFTAIPSAPVAPGPASLSTSPSSVSVSPSGARSPSASPAAKEGVSVRPSPTPATSIPSASPGQAAPVPALPHPGPRNPLDLPLQ